MFDNSLGKLFVVCGVVMMGSSHKVEHNLFQFSGLTPEEFVLTEFAEFERQRDEFVKTRANPTRSKRTVMFNGLAPIDLGMLFGIPFSLALPSLSNFFHFNKDKVKRSPHSNANAKDIYEENPIFKPHVERLLAYFDLLNIPDIECQERAICEFGANPSKFFPISELILSKIQFPFSIQLAALPYKHRVRNNTSITPDTGVFAHYTTAAYMGEVNGTNSCEKAFADKCPYATQQRFNMYVLNVWNFLSNVLRFSLKDDLAFT